MPRARPLALTALLAVMLAACGGGRDAVTIYSGRSEVLVGPLLERFSEETGVPVDVRYGDSSQLALLIEEEGERTPADVFYSQSPGAVGFLDVEGRLDELDPGTLERVEPGFASERGRWAGVSGRQRVLVYNTDRLAPEDLPTSVLDVNDEPWAGRVAVAPENGSFQDFVTALRLEEGDETARRLLEGLVEAGAPTYANNNAIVEAVGRGEVDMGLVNHYYAYRFLEEDPDLPVANHQFGDGDIGSLVIASTVSVVDGAEDPRAQQLVDYLLTDEAQRYFAEETEEYPVVEGVPPDEGVPPLDLEAAKTVDVDALGGGLERTLELIRETGLGG